MQRPRTVRMFLADGTAEGLRILEMSNWTGVALVCGRADWTRVASREEFAKPGVYVLAGDRDGEPAIYIGQAETLRDVLSDIARIPDHVERIVAVASTDAALGTGSRRWLAARLVGIADTTGSTPIVEPRNLIEPELDDADRADVEEFLENALLLVKLAGISAFSPVRCHQEVVANPQRSDVVVFMVSGRVNAKGHYHDNHTLTVGAGARANRRAAVQLSRLHREKRDALIAGGLLQSNGHDFVLTKSVNFSSPSMAASVLLGRSCNGLLEWKTAAGRTLKDLQGDRAPR